MTDTNDSSENSSVHHNKILQSLQEDYSMEAECMVMEAIFFETEVIHNRGFARVTQERDGWYLVAIDSEPGPFPDNTRGRGIATLEGGDGTPDG